MVQIPSVARETADRRDLHEEVRSRDLLSALLGAGGYYGLVVVPSSKLRASLDQVIAKLPSGYKISYAHARYSLITRTATIEGLSGQTQGDDATKFQVAILSIKGPNLDLIDDWNHASASTTALKPDQTIKVADRIAMEGLAVDSPLGQRDGVEVFSRRCTALSVGVAPCWNAADIRGHPLVPRFQHEPGKSLAGDQAPAG